MPVAAVYKGERTKEVNPVEDAEITKLYFQRDEKAITATMEKYGGYCTAIARNILRDEEDALECVNDTYFKAWHTMPPQYPKILATFLGKITRNLSINRYLYNKALKRGAGFTPAPLDELAEIISGDQKVDEALDKAELVKTINNFLSMLSSEKRGIFICRYWYFDSVSEIAKRYNRSENSVSVILNRTRNKLKSYLEERGFTL